MLAWQHGSHSVCLTVGTSPGERWGDHFGRGRGRAGPGGPPTPVPTPPRWGAPERHQHPERWGGPFPPEAGVQRERGGKWDKWGVDSESLLRACKALYVALACCWLLHDSLQCSQTKVMLMVVQVVQRTSMSLMKRNGGPLMVYCLVY